MYARRATFSWVKVPNRSGSGKDINKSKDVVGNCVFYESRLKQDLSTSAILLQYTVSRRTGKGLGAGTFISQRIAENNVTNTCRDVKRLLERRVDANTNPYGILETSEYKIS